ncbi:MAG TPA: ATP-binding protein [Actinomycetota bacterium]|nr:ATP-binding protein [Actinomycetota bacterium]
MDGPQNDMRFRALVEHIPGVALYMDEAIDDDPSHSIPVYISPQIEDMLGYPRDAWLTDEELWLQVLHPDDVERMSREDETARRQATPLSAEYRMIARDGRVVWVSESARVLEDPTTGTTYWQGVMVDITARKEAEDALATEREQTAERLRSALDTARDAANHLRALDSMKNAFLNAVSHELRTPLASVLGSALTLERLGVDLSAGDQRELMHAVATNARKLDRLLADLLDVNRLTRGVIAANRREVELAELAQGIVDEMEADGHVICFEPAPGRVEVDIAKVERILENLLSNAVRHTPPGTTVWLRLGQEGGEAQIVVEDDGPGVRPELREAIFEPFTQADSASGGGQGMGVGLSLVAKFAELHGGRAWVEERVGGGASFRVLLPPRAA